MWPFGSVEDALEVHELTALKARGSRLTDRSWSNAGFKEDNE